MNPYYGPMISTIITSVEEEFLEPEVRMYPNPATDRIRVEGISPRTVYRIYTSLGQLVQTGEFETEIDCQTWQTGMYIVHFQLSDETISRKILKN